MLSTFLAMVKSQLSQCLSFKSSPFVSGSKLGHFLKINARILPTRPFKSSLSTLLLSLVQFMTVYSKWKGFELTMPLERFQVTPPPLPSPKELDFRVAL